MDWLGSFIEYIGDSAFYKKAELRKSAFGLRSAILLGGLGGLAGGVLSGAIPPLFARRGNQQPGKREVQAVTSSGTTSVPPRPSMADRKGVYRKRVQSQMPSNPATPEQLERVQKELGVSPYLDHYSKDFPISRSRLADAMTPDTSQTALGQMAQGAFVPDPNDPSKSSVVYGLPRKFLRDRGPAAPSMGNMAMFHEGIHGAAYRTMDMGQRLAHGGDVKDLTIPARTTIPGLTASETPSTAATFLHMYEHPEFYDKSPADMNKNPSNRSYYPVMYPHPGIRWDVSDFGEKGLGNGYTIHDAINREAPLPVVHELNGKTRPLNESMLEGSNVRPAHRHEVSEYGPQDLEGFEWDDRTPVTVPSTPMGWVVDRRGNFVEPTRDSQITTMGTLTSAGDIEELPFNFRRIIKNVGHGATQGYKDMKADPGEYYATQEDLQAAMEPLYALSKPGVFYGGDPNTEPTVQEIVSGLISEDPATREKYMPWLNLLQPRIQYKIKSLYTGEPAGNVREELEQLLGHSDWSVMEVPELSDEQVLGSYTPGADLEPDMRSLPQMKDSIRRIQEGYRKRRIRALHGDMIGPNVGWA